MSEEPVILILDGDDTLWPAPVEGYLFPRAIIAAYLKHFGLSEGEPGHPIMRKVYRKVEPKKDSVVYKWIDRQSDKRKRSLNPRTAFDGMLKDGVLDSKNKLMKEEGIYGTFLDTVERAEFSMLYADSLKERGEVVRPVLDYFQPIWLYTAATELRAIRTLTCMGVLDKFRGPGCKIIVEEDNMPKSNSDNFRRVLDEIGNTAVFVDDAVSYVENAQNAGLRAVHSAEYCSPIVENDCRRKMLPCIHSFSEITTYARRPDSMDVRISPRLRVVRK